MKWDFGGASSAGFNGKKSWKKNENFWGGGELLLRVKVLRLCVCVFREKTKVSWLLRPESVWVTPDLNKQRKGVSSVWTQRNVSVCTWEIWEGGEEKKKGLLVKWHSILTSLKWAEGKAINTVSLPLHSDMCSLPRQVHQHSQRGPAAPYILLSFPPENMWH